MNDLVRIGTLRPRHFRRVSHSVQPAPLSRPSLRTGLLTCGHPFVDETGGSLVKCFRCSGESSTKQSKDLWAELNEILSKPLEVLPPPEPPKEEEPKVRPVIKTRVREESPTAPRPNEMIACPLCGGKPTLKVCPWCHGTKRKWRHGPRVYPKQKTILFRRYTLEEVERMGFSRPSDATGLPIEKTDEKRIGLLARAWTTAKTTTERWHWEGELANHGWLRPPLTREEMLLKYPPPKPIEDEKKPEKKVTKLRLKRRDS